MDEYIVSEEFEGKRADVYLSDRLNITRSAATKLINDNNALINGSCVQKSAKVKCGDVIRVTIPKPVELSLDAENIPIEILYEDEYLLIVNKPKGMVVHPAPGNYSGTLVNALLYHCKGNLSGINGVIRPGIVHRIDKDTSGLLIVAKNDFAHNHLARQIKEHSFTREYEAIARGIIKNDTGIIEYPIGRHPIKRKQMAVTEKNSRPAKTVYRVLDRTNSLTHIRLTLYTGRTHQIRVHMAYIGHPLAGDTVYGPVKNNFPKLHGQCLHAKKIGFIHPKTNEYMEFESELPDYFKSFMTEEGFNFNGNF